MADNEIGAKIVLTATDQGASATVQKVAGETTNLGTAAQQAGQKAGELGGKLQGTATAATAASRAQALLNEKLEGASPERLKEVEFELQRVIATGNQAGGTMQALKEKLGAVQVMNAGHAGGLDGMAEKISALTSQVPGLQSIGNVFGAVLNPEVATFTALVGTASEAIMAFARKQDLVSGLDAALAQNGQLVEEYREKLQSLASQYGKLVGGAGAWIEVEKHLTQVGADPSHIQEYLEAVKNLAAFLGGDVQQASTLFGRALAGHTEMLARYGIEVDKSASKTEKIKQIMDELAQRGGGQFEARMGTISKEMENLSKSTGGFFSGLGNLISRTHVVQTGLEVLTWTLGKLGDLFPKTVPQMENLTNKVPDLEHALKHASDQTKAASADLEDLGTQATGAKDAADALAQQGLDRLKTSLDGISTKTKETIADLERLQAIIDKEESADMALELAQVKAGGGTDDEKLQKERDIRAKYAEKKQQAADATDQGKIDALDADTDASNQTAKSATADVGKAREPLGDLQQKRSAWEGEYKKQQELQEYWQAALKQTNEMGDYPGIFERKQRQQTSIANANTARDAALKRVQEINGKIDAVNAQVDAAQKVADEAKKDADAHSDKNSTQVAQIATSRNSRQRIYGLDRLRTQAEQKAEDQQRQDTRTREQRSQQREIDTRGTEDKTQPVGELQWKLDAIESSENRDAEDQRRKTGPDELADRNLKERQIERRVRALEAAFKARSPGAAKLSSEQESVFETGLKDAVTKGLPIGDDTLQALAQEAARLVPSAQAEGGGRTSARPSGGAARPARPGGVVIQGYRHGSDGDGLTGGGDLSGKKTAAELMHEQPTAAELMHRRPTAAEVDFGGFSGAFDDHHQANADLHQTHIDNHGDVNAAQAAMQKKVDELTAQMQAATAKIERLKRVLSDVSGWASDGGGRHTGLDHWR